MNSKTALRSCLPVLAVVGLFSSSKLQADPIQASCRTTCLGKWNGPELFIKHGSDYQKISLLDLGLSQPYLIPSDNQVSIYQENADAGAADPYTLIREVFLPKEMTDAILVFIPGEKGAKFELKVLDFNIKTYPGGAARFVNLCAESVEVTLGDQHKVLAPDEMGLLGEEVTDKTTSAMAASFLSKEDDDLQPGLIKTVLLRTPTKRQTFFLSSLKKPDGPPTLTFRVLVDFKR
ncbi:hypothetical protein NT6N_20920 [Oceaniferula spumae]|uniref:DUF4397 domain-containing protein n=1 Tax=Oceaniferula spumae TaxID=2979115 RepID=A0AAT9FMB1_9BACT